MFAFLRRLFTPTYLVRVGPTPHGPGLDVFRKILGLRFRVGRDTFARVASEHIDKVPGWHADSPRGRLAAALDPPTPSLRGGGGVAFGTFRHPAPVAVPAAARASHNPFARPAASVAGDAPRKAAVVAAPPALALHAEPAPVAVAEVAAAPEVAQTVPSPSPAWLARCRQMAQPTTYAELPEVQTAAYLYDTHIRVFMPDPTGLMKLTSRFNGAAPRQLDLVLVDKHYRWVRGGVDGERLANDAAARSRIVDVPGDGACFFHCLAEGLGHTPSTAAVARAEVVADLAQREAMQVDHIEVPICLRDLVF